MLSKAKVAVCSDIHKKQSAQSEHHVEFLNVKPGWYVKKPLGFKRLITITHAILKCIITVALTFQGRYKNLRPAICSAQKNAASTQALCYQHD